VRDWDVWQKHKDYTSIIGLATEIPKETVAKLEQIGFVVDDGSKPAAEAGQLFILHVRDLDKRNYWKKYEEYKTKYGGAEPRPVHIEELPELIIRFLGTVTPDECIRITNFTLDLLIKK
jgi:hypothetical protein